MAIDIKELSKEHHQIMIDKGFWKQQPNVGQNLMLIVSELSEALEAHRKDHFGYEQKDTFEDEIADTLLRIFDMCEGMDIDIERQLKWKLEFNKNRIFDKKY